MPKTEQDKNRFEENSSFKITRFQRRGRLRFMLPYIMIGTGALTLALGTSGVVVGCSESIKTSDITLNPRIVTRARSDVLEVGASQNENLVWLSSIATAAGLGTMIVGGMKLRDR